MATLPTHFVPSSSSSTFYITIILFAIISCLLYKFVLSPGAPTETLTTPASPAVVTTSNNTAASVASQTSSETRNINSKSNHDDYFSYGTHRHPPHLIVPDKWDKSTSLTKYVLNGIVPFRSTAANGYETRLQKELSSEDLMAVNRKERARIFARLFSSTASEDGSKKPPPNRGANIVVTIYPNDASCAKLQKALMLLGTYYNLFMLVDGAAIGTKQPNEQREYVRNFRQKMLITKNDAPEASHQLNSHILPPHRIVFLSTTAGRVAFVRQLNGVQFVVDMDEKVTKELKRFGHRVLLYPGEGSDGTSALGKFLIP